MPKKPTEESLPEMESRSRFVWYPGDIEIIKDGSDSDPPEHKRKKGKPKKT